MEYYYTEPVNINTVSGTLFIKGFEHRHLSKVLRKTSGETITVTDGKRNIYKCTIVRITKDSIECSIDDVKHNLFEPEVNVRLYVSPLRNQDRFEFLIEKAVELGVFEIQPVITNRTVLKSSFSDTKLERFKKIIISAMSQSQRCYMPQINNIIDLDGLIDSSRESDVKYLYYEFAEENQAPKKKFKQSDNICILIGPEGGFEENEIQKLLKNKWQLRSLGKRKLRAETAAILSVFENINFKAL